MKYVLLLAAGLTIFVLGLLLAAHKPFQDWRLSHEKKPIDPKSEEYQTAIFHMKINGSGVALLGGLLILTALSGLGLID
jgi:hypothetical protein